MNNNKIYVNEWQDVTLGDVLKYEQPYKYTVESTQYLKSGIPVLTAGKSFILGYTDETENIYSDLPVIIFDDFTSDSKYVNFPFKVKSSAMKFIKVRNRDKASLKYFFEILQSLKLDSIGGDHKRRWISEFSKILIKVPQIEEQTRIAEILSTTDEAIAHTEALIAKYQRIKTGLMQDLLTKGIDENGKIRSKETHKFVVKNGIEVPEEWEVITVEQFASKSKHAIVDGPFGSNLKIIHYRISGIPIIQSGFVTNNSFEAKDYLFVDRELFNREIRSKAEPGDLIMAKIGVNCGTCALLPIYHLTSIIAGNALKISVDSNNINRYLEVLFHYLYTIDKFEDIKSTTAQPAISMQQLKKLFIPRPSKREQLQIIKRIDAIDELINLNKDNLSKLNSLKTGLMQDLLSGKIRVKTE